MVEELQKFQEELERIQTGKKIRWEKERMYLLLSILPCIVSQEYTNQMKLCDEEQIEKTKEHLQKVGIHDQDSLYAHMRYNFNCGDQYDQFVTFWDGTPCFDEAQLKPEAKDYFHFCMDYAKQFSPYVKTFGFRAWDIGEGIHRIREAYTCGYIDEEAAMHDINIYVQQAYQHFHNFREYAMSYVCGATYFMMRETRNEEHVRIFQQMMLKVSRLLLFDEEHNYWTKIAWLPTSEFFPELEEVEEHGIKNGNLGCFVTDRVSKEGAKITYFYHDTPAANVPDSGWRFFAGDESEAYLQDSANTHIFALDTVISVFPELAKWMKEPEGSAVMLGKDGAYYKFDLEGKKNA